METARRPRPSRAEIEPAALELIRTHGAQIMAVARRYAVSPEDAEDAYQRGLEILLTKAPSTSADDLVPWLKTVVKHEAFAIRKQRTRCGEPTEHDETVPAPADTHDHVERLERLQRGAEAMQRLKPQEIRCLLLLAEGHSYAEICAITGFSYTKVNRCLAEGRVSFLKRVDGIESGAECERLAPLISAAADGEANGEDVLLVRRHVRGCLACRASLREARAVPARVAALAPAGIALAPHAGEPVVSGGLQGAWSWLHERLSSLALRGQEVAEMAAGHKAAAVAASAAALAGGGAATMHGVAADRGDGAAAAGRVVRSAPTATVQVARERRAPLPAPAAPPPAAAPQARTAKHSRIVIRRRPSASTLRAPEPAAAPAASEPPHAAAPGPVAPPTTRSSPPANAGGGEFAP